ncbi:hypothetical protein J514_0703 [Acinetobacter sp. 1396970]|nr:hypothetical protein J514_0703 [Acinetobacter sp. 1396970]
MCHVCHAAFDKFELGTRQESEELFDGWLEKTKRMLSLKDEEIF